MTGATEGLEPLRAGQTGGLGPTESPNVHHSYGFGFRLWEKSVGFLRAKVESLGKIWAAMESRLILGREFWC